MRVFICEELITNLEANISKIKETLSKIDRDNYEAYLIYDFALFESAFCEAMRHILSAFPEKISNEKQLSLPTNVIYNNIFSPQVILSSLIDCEIKKLGKGSLTVLVEAERICAVKLTYEQSRLEEISFFRNLLTHENTPSQCEYLFGKQNCISKHYDIEDSKKDITYLLSVLESFSSEMKNKYSKYTKYRLLESLWSTLFNTPLLKFENCVLIREWETGSDRRKVVGFNFDYIKKASTSISSGEKFFLSMLLQQYSTSINEQYFKFKDIPMLVSIADKKKIYLFLHVMNVYPHLFNGMNMEEGVSGEQNN